MKKFDIFIDFGGNLEKLQNTLNKLKNAGFVMACDFKKDIPTAQELHEQFYKYNHGNAKMILNLFYNDITGRKEIATGYKAIYQTYPQYKNIKIKKV